MNKKGMVSATAQKYIGIAVSVIVLFTLMAAFYPEMVAAGDDLKLSKLPV